LIGRGLSRSLQRELDTFSKEVLGGQFNIREVTKGAFSQARSKLKPEAFKELNADAAEVFYQDAPYQVWHGHRLLAVYGTRLMLPRHKSVIQEFGEHGFGPNADSKRSLAMASFLYDPVNLLTLDAQIAPYASSERELLYQHLQYVKAGDLLLLDRGYPGLALFFLLKARKIDFCVRMKEDWWLAVKDFKDSGKQESLVEFTLPKKDRELLEAYPKMHHQKITCRLVLIELDNGEKEVLCTSLTDSNIYTHEDIKELYHFRWNIEEGYKLFKSRIEVEDFSGKTAIAVKQDFYAKVYMMTMCAILAFPIEEKIKKEYEAEKQKYQSKINRTTALANYRDAMVPIFIKRMFRQALQAFDNIVRVTTEIIRPGRLLPRKHRTKKQYYMNYKKL
jgi:hypothetical protein